ncbi:MAG TPA: SDR family NAD(P)-dependent oxidoreductase [Ohtaekwangia sp.]
MIHNSHSISTRQILALAAGGLAAYALIRRVIAERNRQDLGGKVILITGASRGLGLVLARQLAVRGSKIIICARDSSTLSRATLELKTLGVDALGLSADITDRSQVRDMIRTIISRYGTIDILINNAGIIQVGPFETMEMDDFETAMKTNFWGALYCMQEVLPYFKTQKYGHIVNITSIGGKIAVPHMLPYTASKFALTGLSEGMHAELKKNKITVTTVVPNLMRTGSARQITVKGKHKAEYAWFKIAASSPLTAQHAERAAQQIIEGIEYRKAEIILTPSAKLATIIQGLAPGFVSSVLAIVNVLLPSSPDIQKGRIARKGHESESMISRGFLTRSGNQAALNNNEI